VNIEDEVSMPTLLPADDVAALLDDVDGRPGHALGREHMNRRVEVPDELLLDGRPGRRGKHNREHDDQNP
jgi:hypothetical protein